MDLSLSFPVRMTCWSIMIFATLQYASVSGACKLPKILRGNWISSDTGVLNFTDNTIEGYPSVVLLGGSKPVSMVCMGAWGNMYMFRAPGVVLGRLLYTCFEFHAVSDVKMWYQQATEYTPSTGARYIHTSMNSTTTIKDACNRQRPYRVSSFHSLLKEGSFEDGYPGVMCPTNLYHTFSQGTIRSSTQTCQDNDFDVCGNRTQIRLGYASWCGYSLKMAADGSYVCLLPFAGPGGVTYLHLYNKDTTLQRGVSRINCLAFTATDTSLQATLFPGSCWENQTDTYVGPTGIHMHYAHSSKTCQDPAIKPSPIGLYAGIAAGVLIFILIVIGTIYCIYKTRCLFIKRLYKKTRIGTSNSEEISSTISKGLSEGNDFSIPPLAVIPESHPPLHHAAI